MLTGGGQRPKEIRSRHLLRRRIWVSVFGSASCDHPQQTSHRLIPLLTHFEEESHRYSTSIPVSYFPVSIAAGAAFPGGKTGHFTLDRLQPRAQTFFFRVFQRQKSILRPESTQGLPSFAMGSAGMDKPTIICYDQISSKPMLCRMP